MDEELKALEEKIVQLLQFCQHLRSENISLRQQLAQALDAQHTLSEKISGAKNRLESLLEQIPENSK